MDGCEGVAPFTPSERGRTFTPPEEKQNLKIQVHSTVHEKSQQLYYLRGASRSCRTSTYSSGSALLSAGDMAAVASSSASLLPQRRGARLPHLKGARLPHLKMAGKLRLIQACFLYTFEKTQGQNNSMFWPLAKNSRIFSPKTQSYEAQSKTWWYRILALKL